MVDNILYASETGTAEGFAPKAARQMGRYRPKVMALDEYNTNTLSFEKLLLIVTSTFSNGEMPGNSNKFLQWLKQQSADALKGLNYSVLGIGSTVYEHFCAAGIAVDKALSKAGANCIVPLHKGDEIKGQACSILSAWRTKAIRPKSNAAAAPEYLETALPSQMPLLCLW